MVDYDEFGLFHENAEEFGLPWDGPPKVRRESVEVAPDGRRLSALVWGDAPPDVVLLHGGAQNAHTWDTVALALDRPLVAIDLPGHGHSDHRPDGPFSPRENAVDVAVTVRAVAPDARMVVGMSLGGLTTIALTAHAPELVRRATLVDVTPGVDRDKAAPIAQFISGPESFESFDEILERTVQFNPTRSVSSLRRGILHNAVERDDGRWVWRYQRPRLSEAAAQDPAQGMEVPADFAALWDDVSAIKVPLMLVRGMATGTVVDDGDEAELLRRQPGARVERVEGAGHSIQGDKPVELAALLADFLDG
jgi:pimeloyl-ACP methyl ester carboxylesterase